MGIYLYQEGRWRQHQSNVTSFMNFLKKNKDNIHNKELYTYKLIELNQLYDRIDNIIEEIKYECIYQDRWFKNNKKIQEELKHYFKQKQLIKKLVCLEPFIS